MSHSNVHAFRQEALSEMRKLIRDPGFVLPSFGFPLGFFVLFALIMPFANTAPAQLAMIANYGAFGTLAAAMFAAGMPLAQERDTGIYALKMTTPLGLLSYLAAKMSAAAVFALTVAAAVLLLGLLTLPVSMKAGAVAAYFAATALGACTFAGLGLLIGARFALNAAPVVINMVFMPMAFLGGLVLPLMIMPKLIQQASVALPSFHMGQLNRAAVGAGSITTTELLSALVMLTGISIAALMATRFLLLRGRT